MASTRARYRITDDMIELLEGQLQELRQRVRDNPAHVPSVAMPMRFVSGLIDVPPRVIQRWLKEAGDSRAREEYKCFAEVFLQFVSLFAGRYEANIQKIANDTSNRNSLAANLKLLERMGEGIWGPAEIVDSDNGVAGIPPDLADELTDDEYEELLRREEEDQRRAERDAALLDRLRARKAQRRVETE